MTGTESRLGRVIAIGNQKGGVGKTTTTCHLAAALGERGRKVLIFDLDMNSGATRSCGLHPPSYVGTPEVLLGEERPADVIVTELDTDVVLPAGVHLLPSRRQLEDTEIKIRERNKFAPFSVLRPIIADLRQSYDYILLDTAPNATLPTLAAYQAASFFILTAIPDAFSMAGLIEAMTDIKQARENGNPDLRLLGVVLTAVDRRTNIASQLSEYIKTAFNDTGKFDTEISRTVAIVNAQKNARTLLQSEPTHKVSDQYRRLATETEDRCRSIDGIGAAGASRSVDAAAIAQGEQPATSSPAVQA